MYVCVYLLRIVAELLFAQMLNCYLALERRADEAKHIQVFRDCKRQIQKFRQAPNKHVVDRKILLLFIDLIATFYHSCVMCSTQLLLPTYFAICLKDSTSHKI